LGALLALLLIKEHTMHDGNKPQGSKIPVWIYLAADCGCNQNKWKGIVLLMITSTPIQLASASI
jgi:hypothetical protein